MSEIQSVRFRETVRPFRMTFSTSLGRKDVMKSIIVTVHLKDGSTGIGECPTSFTIKEETFPAIKEILAFSAAELKGLPIEDYDRRVEKIRRAYPRNPMTMAGLETALFRSYLTHKNVKEHTFFGGESRFLETDITIPCTTDWEALRKWMRYAFSRGFTVYKIKVSGDFDLDRKLCAEVYRLLDERGTRYLVRFDGNQGFTAAAYLFFVDFLRKNDYDFELFEQPLPKNDYRGLKEVAKTSPVPVILDETVFTSDDLEKVITHELGHGINIKIAKSGISGSLRLYDKAKQSGLKIMIGCMTETMVGLSAGINLAAGKGGFDYIDLDAVHFLRHKTTCKAIDIEGPGYVIR